MTVFFVMVRWIIAVRRDLNREAAVLATWPKFLFWSSIAELDVLVMLKMTKILNGGLGYRDLAEGFASNSGMSWGLLVIHLSRDI